jgi:type IV pilus assembly protein PilQ
MVRKTLIKKFFAGAVVLAGFLAAQAGFAQSGTPRNTLQKVDVAASGDRVTVRMTFSDPLKAIPGGFSLASPPRVALDIPNTESAVSVQELSTARGFLRNVRLAQSDSRLRVVLNLDRSATYQSKLDGNDLLVTLSTVPQDVSGATKSDVSFRADPGNVKKNAAVRDVMFRRGPGGEGRILIDLEDPAVGIDVRKQGNEIMVEFANSSVADTLLRKLDVTDFNTPVSTIVTTRSANSVKVQVTPRSADFWEHIAYQTDNQFVVEVRAIQEDNTQLGGGIGRYTGERMSLRFRDYPVREVIQAFSDFANLNIVISDSVSGTITLNLQDVPWDQALDVILQQKNLQMDKRGNVVTIAPKEEILARRKANTELVTFDPVRDVVIALGYIGAAHAKTKIEDYLKSDGRTESKSEIQGVTPGLSGGALGLQFRGGTDVTLRITVDEQTNKIFIRASEATIQAIRTLLKEIDVPPRQVLIEARIVEANETFTRDLGAKLGFTTKGGTGSTPQYDLAGGSNLSLPLATTTPGALQFWLANASTTRTLSLELAAAETDGRTKLVSSPRVLTANGTQAKISDGEQVPYSTISSTGTKTEFKDATLNLTIKPNINADGRVALKINVDKNSVGSNTAAGPTILTKTVTTEVVVENGGTVVIGGIYKEDNRDSVSKVPFLGDLPLIGWMFRQTSKSSQRAETLVFITPRIVGEDLSFR